MREVTDVERVRKYSMGVPHRAVPGTVGVCLGAAALTRGTLAHKLFFFLLNLLLRYVLLTTR